MFGRVLNRIRRLVLERRYIVTLHADDELSADDLTVAEGSRYGGEQVPHPRSDN